jgi:hypothetical protein
MTRRPSFIMIPAGLAGFVIASIIWIASRRPLPIWWVVLDAASLLSIGWGVVLLLPRRAMKWGVTYMAIMMMVIPSSHWRFPSRGSRRHEESQGTAGPVNRAASPMWSITERGAKAANRADQG